MKNNVLSEAQRNLEKIEKKVDVLALTATHTSGSSYVYKGEICLSLSASNQSASVQKLFMLSQSTIIRECCVAGRWIVEDRPVSLWI